MQQFEKILDFDKIKYQLSNFAKTEDGKKKCIELSTFKNINDIENSLNQIDYANEYIIKGYDFNFFDIKNKKIIIKKLEKQITLSIEEIVNIKYFLLNINEIVNTYNNREINNNLNIYFDKLNPMKNIYNLIDKIVINQNTISSGASETLKNIRILKTKTNEEIKNSLNDLMLKYRNFLQDNIIVNKNNRYCLSFKNEYKSKIKGIIQDVSSSKSTIYIEPIEIIELSNKLTDLELEEKNEIYKILTDLTKKISNHIDEIIINCDTISDLDFIFAKLKFAKSNNHTKPIINNNKFIKLTNATHPLIDKKKCVPLNITISNEYKCLIITGPNTGGKTVCIKTIGLIHLMGLSGMFIPCDENSNISYFDNIYVDIGDEQSIEQNLSTFSAHIKNIIYILNNATDKSLCLIDEICTGTDPIEGAHLSIGILEYLIEKNILSIITTHYSELKLFAISKDYVLNGSFEFDLNNLSPTYRLIMGIPGKSNAFLICEKLGMDKSIINRAKNMVNVENVKFEDIISELEYDKKNLEKEIIDFNLEKKNIDNLKSKIQHRQKELSKSEKTIINNAYKKAKKILEDAKKESDTYLSNIKTENNNIISLKTKLNNSISEIDENLKTKIKGPTQPISPKKIKIGDRVKILSMNTEGVVETLPDRNYNLYIRIGIIKTLINLKNLEIIKTNKTTTNDLNLKKYNSQSNIKYEKSKNMSNEINLIGMTTDEAIIKLDKYLDDCYLSNLPSCRIIHGIGTGALKKAITNHLKKINFINEFRDGEYNEGGYGVTVVIFK